jgi:hypothetical protein
MLGTRGSFNASGPRTFAKMSGVPFVKNALPTEADWAYAAGFFDGEGHIRIQQHSTRCRTMMLQVSLTQATQTPIDWFAEMFGGTWKARLVRYKDGPKTQYNWQASSAVAERFLRGVLAHLRCKRDEADLALKFRATFRPQHVKGGHKRMDDAVLLDRAAMSARLKKMRIDKRLEAAL